MNIKLLNVTCGMRADGQCYYAPPLHAIVSTFILLSQVRAGPADDAVKMNASSEMEVLYPCSLLIQFTHRRQEYVAFVTTKKGLEKYTSSRSGRCVFFPLRFFFVSLQ